MDDLHGSGSMPGSAPWKSSPISVELLDVTSSYLDLLREWSTLPYLKRPHVVIHSIYRYEHCWLPLLVTWGNSTDVVPPPDVYWVWHLHMLLPSLYIDYCTHRFGKIVPHQLPKTAATPVEQEARRERTRVIWRDRCRDEPYDLDAMNVVSAASSPQQNGTQLTNLVHLSSHATNFYHQVELVHYRDISFLFRAVDRYRQLLHLKRMRPDITLNIPLDVQLLWRVHMLHPVMYDRDVRAGIGCRGALAEVGSDGRFIMDAQSNAHWHEMFGESLYLNGTGYRGMSHTEDIRSVNEDSFPSPVVDSCDITFHEISVSELWSKDKTFTVEARRLGQTSFSGCTVFRVAGKIGETISSSGSTSLGSVHFESSKHRAMEFHIYKPKPFCSCMGSGEEKLNTVTFNPREPFGNQTFQTRKLSYEVPKVSYTDPRIVLTCSIKAAMAQPHVLSMDRDPFGPTKLPSDLRPFVADLASWHQALDTEGLHGKPDFVSARHGLKSRQGKFAFGCQIVKQEASDLGAVLVYYNNDRLVAAAFSVADDILATQEQLSSSCGVTFDPEEDEHAMLLRNSDGDYAVVIARWRPTSHPSGEGMVHIRVCYVNTGHETEVQVRDDEMQAIKVDDVIIDMPSGRFSIDSKCSCIPETVALGMCVGVLFVTCQKRVSLGLPASMANGSLRSLKSTISDLTDLTDSDFGNAGKLSVSANSKTGVTRLRMRKKMSRRKKMSASFTFLLACGLQIDITLHGGSASVSRANSISKISLAGLADDSHSVSSGRLQDSMYLPPPPAPHQSEGASVRRTNKSGSYTLPGQQGSQFQLSNGDVTPPSHGTILPHRLPSNGTSSVRSVNGYVNNDHTHSTPKTTTYNVFSPMVGKPLPNGNNRKDSLPNDYVMDIRL